MPVLTQAQLETLAKGAGFKGDDIKIAAAVALAESGGNTDAHNNKPPDDSYGLWQINMLGKLGPARRYVFHIKSNTELFNPETNARAAHIVWNGSGWNAWTTYTSGKYKEHLNASDATAGMGAPATATGPTGIVGAVTASVNSLGDTIFKGVANIGGILLGIVLLVLGVVLLARTQVGNLLPANKVLKAAKAVSK